MNKKNILFINGIPDTNKITAIKIEKNGEIKWKGSGSANLMDFLGNHLFDSSLVIFDTSKDDNISRQTIHAVFNQIADPDTHKTTLAKAENFYKKVSSHVPFFNPPSLIVQTTRDNISKTLQGIDRLHVPKTVKIQPISPKEIHDVIKKEGFSYPVIFRQAGDHGGISTKRVENKTEQFHQFALDGRDYYLTQFVEYAKDGIYTKYRLVVVDGGHVRVGIEDSIYYDYAKSKLATNVELVQRIVRIASELQRDIATSEQAKKMLGLDI